MNQPASAAADGHALADVTTIDNITTTLPAVLQQLEEVLMGKREQTTMALACLLARGHLLIEDVPGVGKTTLAHALGATLGLAWTRVQFTSDLLPADVVGVTIFDSGNHAFQFKPGPVFTAILLADEINRAPPRAQSALLEAMEERQVTVDGVSHALDDDFFVIATQNPMDQLGAFPLPESQLDRFLVGIEIGYPDTATERALLERGDQRTEIAALEPLLDVRQLQRWRSQCAQVYISPPIFDYIQALLQATRQSSTGLSPRAGLSLVRLCRAFAFLHNRSHVLPEDVRDVFPALAGHRLTGHVSSGQMRARELLEQVVMP
ncbi:MAG: MoxR family ATPase [Granulosicoccus sp.]|nr:MoxR family ATPase [Granulosicoccus sp.]